MRFCTLAPASVLIGSLASADAPKPPAELDAVTKALAGNWRCKGDAFAPTGAKSQVTATITSKIDLDKFWLADTVVVKGGPNLKINGYTTYDGKAGKWRRVAVDSAGGYMVGTSDGMKDGKLDWILDTVGPQGTGLFRDHIDASDAKKGVKMWGEMSMDKARTWTKVYELACTK